jgi:16S rRNA (guanine966-N2)-methyltransferase
VRVIAGAAKGIRLAPVPRGVRPVSDMAREGVFSSLGQLVAGARVLDLYAGTGALGIEALSRGAASAVFVERSHRAVRAIRDNLDRARATAAGTVVASEVLRFLMRDDTSDGGFELVFADPPYETGEGDVSELLARLAQGWLAESWTVVLTRPSRNPNHVIPVDWPIARRLSYGDTLVLVYDRR